MCPASEWDCGLLRLLRSGGYRGLSHGNSSCCKSLNFWTKESGALRGVRVRLLRLTCRVADRPAPPEMTQTGRASRTLPHYKGGTELVVGRITLVRRQWTFLPARVPAPPDPPPQDVARTCGT
jgi:hypothetical protein